MGWTISGSIKGPKGDAGDASGGTLRGTFVFADASSTAAKSMLASNEWYFSGKLYIYANGSTGEISFSPATGYTKSTLYVFMKL